VSTAILRHSSRDALLVLLAGLHGALLLGAPSAPLVAIGMWWNANTVAHNFIHGPFFRARSANVVFSAYLSLVLGLPQTLWRDRHLAHHAGRPWRPRWSASLAIECALVAALWLVIAAQGPRFFIGTWLTGWVGGLVLCTLQGYYEHSRGAVSHYGALYNLAFFNDGYHVEHHARPGVHWRDLPRHTQSDAPRSRWPAVLRWLDLVSLESLERLVLRSPRLQRFVLDRHARAFRTLLGNLPPIYRVTIVGGGLFPRTALVLRRLIPSAAITIIDRSADNLARAKPMLDESVRLIEAPYSPELCTGADLLVIPLSFSGDRHGFYDQPPLDSEAPDVAWGRPLDSEVPDVARGRPAPAVAVHDWIWQRRGVGANVSLLLLKRLNLIR